MRDAVRTMAHDIFYISPLTDFGFKKIFGDPVIMKRFLEVLYRSQRNKLKIQGLTYIPQEGDGNYKTNRRVVYDVHCLNRNGEEIIVEMQNDDQYFWDKRIMYYLSRSTSMQGDKSLRDKIEEFEPWDYDIKRVVGIFMMNFMDDNEPLPVSRNCWMNTKSRRIVSNLQEFWKIQLPYYRKSRMKEEECKTLLDYWLYNLANMDTMKTTMPFTDKDSAIKHMSDISYYFSMSYKEQQQYFHEMDAKITYRNAMAKQMDKATAEATAKGMAQGLAQGMAQGMAQGRVEGEKNKAYDTAKKMLAKNMSIDDIMYVSGLSREEIEAITI